MKNYHSSNLKQIGRRVVSAGVVIVAVFACAIQPMAAPAAAADTEGTPYQVAVVITLNPGENARNADIRVPTGKLLVVEHVSGIGYAQADQLYEFMLMTRIAPDSISRSHYLNADRDERNGLIYYTISQPITAYADAPGASVRVSRNNAYDSVTFRFTVSGRLIDK